MTNVENRATTQTVGESSGVALTFAYEADGLNVSPEERHCCGEKMQSFWVEDGRRMSVCSHCHSQFLDSTQIHDARSPWIGVDLDGTLASDIGREMWDADGKPKIGRPIEEMVLRVKKWIAKGFTVKIFTARAASPVQVAAIKTWLVRRGLPDLEVTNVKDLNMIELWDDRCVQVVTNFGRPVNPDGRTRRSKRPARALDPDWRKTSFGLLSRLKIFLTL